MWKIMPCTYRGAQRIAFQSCWMCISSNERSKVVKTISLLKRVSSSYWSMISACSGIDWWSGYCRQLDLLREWSLCGTEMEQSGRPTHSGHNQSLTGNGTILCRRSCHHKRENGLPGVAWNGSWQSFFWWGKGRLQCFLFWSGLLTKIRNFKGAGACGWTFLTIF